MFSDSRESTYILANFPEFLGKAGIFLVPWTFRFFWCPRYFLVHARVSYLRRAFSNFLKILPWLFRFFMISARFSGYTWSERLFQPMPNFFRFLKFLPWPGRRSFRERICRVRPEFLYLRRALSDFWSTFRFFWCPRYFPNFLGKVEFFYLRRVFPDFWRFFRRPFW